MNEKIKEILDNFKNNYDELGICYYPEDILGPDDLKPLYNYITTLQQENEKSNNIINNAIEYIEKNTHNIYADGYRDRKTGKLLSIEKTPIVNRIFSENPQKLLEILNDRRCYK